MGEPVKLSLATNLENRTSSTSKDAKIVNGYVEKLGDDTLVVRSRPGHDAGTLYLAGAVQGVTSYLGVSRIVISNRFYKTSSTYASIDAGGLDVDFE